MKSAFYRFVAHTTGRHQRNVAACLRGRRDELVVLAVYVLLTVAMSWPVVPRITTHLTGLGGDLWEHWWNLSWLKESILDGNNPFYTTHIFHPRGVSMVYHNFAWLLFSCWLPLQVIVGPIAALNVAILSMFALSGYTMFLLARDVTRSSWAGFVAGVVYAFWPYTQSHFDHPNFRAIPWFPLALFYQRRLLRNGRWRDVIGLAMALALIGLTRWQLLTMAAVIVGTYFVCHWMTCRDARQWRSLLQMAVAGALAFSLLLPLLSPILFDVVGGGIPSEVMIDEQVWGQTDLLSFVLPSRYQPLWGSAVWPWYENLIVNKVYIAFVGYIPLTLSVVALLRNRRQTLFWGLLGLAFILLALGPVLRVNGRLLHWLPMPYRLVEDLVFVRVLRKPDRFNIALGLPIGMLTAWGIECLRRRFAWVGNGVITLIAGLILLEYWVFPFPTVRVDTPAWYHQLAEDPDQFAILDLPMDPVTFDKDYMAYQVVHGKALVGGKISRPTSEAFQFIDEHPFLRGLYEENDMDPALGAVSHQLAHLAEHDVRYIILHIGNLSAEKLARWRDWLTIEPTYESEALVVYQTEPRLGRDFELVHRLTESVGLIRWTVSPTTTQQGGTVSIDVRWGSSAPVEREFDVKLSLVSDEGETVQSMQMPLRPDWPSDQWRAHAVVRGEYTLQVYPFAPPERLWLQLALTAKNEDVIVGEPVMLDTLTVRGLPRTFNVPSIEHELSASFGSELDLLGYDLLQENEALEIILHWRARRPMAVPYKFFVHLYSREDGKLAAQADVMPHNWTYPTTWWVEGEIVSDRVHLSMEDLQAGQYQLAVGVYHPDSGERLPVRGSPPELNYKDGRMMLPLVIEH